MRTILLVGLFLIALLSCKENDNNQELAIYDKFFNPKDAYSLKTHIVTYGIEAEQIEFYSIFSVKTINDTSFYVGYNDTRHQLDFFSIDHKGIRFQYFLPLEKEGPNGINKIVGIELIEQGIFILETNHLKLINNKGEVEDRKKLNVNNFYITAHDNSGLISLNNQLLVGLHNANISKTKYPKRYYQTQIFGLLNTINLDLTILPPTFPQLYTEKYFGFMDVPHSTANNNSVFFTLPADYKVYEYNLNTDSLFALNTEPVFVEKSISGLDWPESTSTDNRLDHFVRSQYFGKPLAISENIIVRFYRDKFPSDIKDISYPLKKKDTYISIIDLDKNHYQDFKIEENNIALDKAFIVDGSIYIPFFSEKENQLKFIKITINEKVIN